MVGLECNLNLLVYKEECILVQEVYEVTKGPVQFSQCTYYCIYYWCRPIVVLGAPNKTLCKLHKFLIG